MLFLLTFIIHCVFASTAWTIITPDPQYTKNVRQYLIFKLGPETEWGKEVDRIPELVLEAIKPYGYLDAQIHIDQTHHRLEIQPSSPLEYRRLEITPSPDCRHLTFDPPWHAGMHFDNPSYVRIKNHLLHTARMNGHLQAHVSGQARVEPPFVDLRLNVICGKPYRLAAVKVDSPFEHDLYQRHARAQIQQVVGPKDLMDFQTRLQNRTELGQFEVTESLDEELHTVTWHIQHLKSPSTQQSIGAGMITGRGPDLMLQYATVLIPSAHSMKLIGHFSTQALDGEALYSVPSSMIPHASHDFRIFHELFPGKLFQQVSQSELSYRLSLQETHARTEYGLSFQYHRDKPDDVVIDSYALVPQIYHWFQRDLGLGHLSQWAYTLKASPKILGNDFSFLLGEIRNHRRGPISAHWLYKTDLHVAGIAHQGSLQDSWRYRLGGPNSVMGYGLDEKGPGDLLMTARLGMFYALSSSWYLGPWITAGSASNTVLSPLYVGAALALDLQTPVGAIECALAKSAHHRLQFSIGLLPL